MDVPEDIREKAFKFADGWSHDDEERDDMQADLARLLLAERLAQRERDAKIAEEAFHRGMPIAAAIREQP